MAEEIHHHTFKPVEQPTASVISLTFSLLVIACFVILLISLLTTIKCKNLHFGFFAFIFVLVFSATLTFIAYFWFYLTLMETLGLFVLIMPVTCLFALIASKVSL